ncbi:putative ribosome biogenesis GTPase Lsg1 [Truncatella angustata]|uniref:Ribosome biogenesis GTPase Lsg1 n=1 Tax=Truncatella angustata TaxID=152316 RepID=A0A9P8UN02_9PEZI|nr:putative ribosome biogenesis GTPase Lsg1 [Truncatella angustata]KAH6655140.1 putative ribosome biogenesis GTPase Lsg1 [Truncatella angustata]KAH8200428.1 hypothetical protein TruAng_005391 [Truncatella angustata]
MPLAKSKQTVGLGNSLMNDRFGKGKGADRKKATGSVVRTQKDTGESYVTNERKEASWVKMRSVTQQSAMDEFLATAELAGTDFTAEKMNNVKIIHTDQRNPYLLSATEESRVRGKHDKHRKALNVPRRPKWDEHTTPEELDLAERESFLSWRRGLAELAENNDLLMTPFERNLEIWRQLWRVIERSHLVVQIVDARNPLMFRSEDLEHYVKDVDQKKENLLLVNKADMMTVKQRKEWAKYFKANKIAYRFFSAHLAKELIDAQNAEDESDEDVQTGHSSTSAQRPAPKQTADETSSDEDSEEGSEGEADASAGASLEQDLDDEDIRILTVEELEDIFLAHAPEPNPDNPDEKLQIGLVGYPNVGKSSTINALIGAKKVSVSSTPGKTKHFQTIHLSDNVILCDCPGLVFPNFASTNADLVCNGVLPIDQLREYTGPATLVTHRIPQLFLEAIYGIKIKTRPFEEGGTGVPSSSELLSAYAKARGFQTQGHGQPDESRAARTVLKDYVNGKLLYCEPPPGYPDAAEFNRELYDSAHLPEKRRAQLQAAMEALELPDDSSVADSDVIPLPKAGPKSQRLDKNFFARNGGNAGHMSRPFSYKYTEQGQAASAAVQGKPLSGRKAKAMVALETGMDPKDVQIGSSKKHFKGGAKGKKKKAEDDD